jgi:membrane associated rhomboid family serine protease
MSDLNARTHHWRAGQPGRGSAARRRRRSGLAGCDGLIFFPYGTERRVVHVPYATYTIIGLNVVVWIVCLSLGVQTCRDVIWQKFGLVPSRFHWYQLVTSLFLHDVPLPLHLAGNMFFLWLFGRHVEDVLGWPLFAAVYLIGGVAAHALNVLVASELAQAALGVSTIGASGALATTMGIYAVRFYQTKTVALLGVGLPPLIGWARRVLLPSMFAVAIWLGWEVIQGALSMGTAGGGGVAHWAHIGGAAFGIVAAFALGLKGEAQDMYEAANAHDLFRVGDWKGAAICFEEVVKDEPENADAYVKLATCYDLIGRPQRGVRAFLKAIELYQSKGEADLALDAFSKMLRHHETDRVSAGEHARLARLFLSLQEYEDAARTYEALARVHPRAPEAERAVVESARIWLQHLSRPDRALQLFSVIKQQRPDSQWMAEVESGMATARERLGEAPVTPDDLAANRPA